MIMTDEQRRWWFATHPEFSWSRKGIRRHGQRSQQPSGHPAADRGTYDKYEEVVDVLDHELELLRQAIERDKMGLEADPHTFLDLFPLRRFVTSPIRALGDLVRSKAGGYVLNAVRRGTSEGPGQWVEVARSRLGLEHQSRMSGQPIRPQGGKLYIKEYELNGVRFDDYKDGRLYEYKGPQGNLMKRDGLFPEWARLREEARQAAERQVQAAQGIPVIWKVGADQVEAFKKAVGDLSGITIVP